MKIVDRRGKNEYVQAISVYPFLSPDATEPQTAFSGLISAVKSRHEEVVSIHFNIHLETMTIAHFDRLQQALNVVREIAGSDLLTNLDLPLPQGETDAS